MKWVSYYWIALDEIVQRPFDEARYEEFKDNPGFINSRIEVADEPFPKLAIVMKTGSELRVYRPDHISEPSCEPPATNS